jgi:hypothetical protein
MSREVHVRIWEGVGVRFPHATRLFLTPGIRRAVWRRLQAVVRLIEQYI